MAERVPDFKGRWVGVVVVVGVRVAPATGPGPGTSSEFLSPWEQPRAWHVAGNANCAN